ncbi:hypothetical protein [Maricaulis sp.]|uniref:hypothetical protein n=1 Tax=Maricaulis sp. TaxID=1486257 RepID=UPI003A8CC534
MMLSSSREHFATWIGVIGTILLLAAGLGAFNAEYIGALISGGIGAVLVSVAVLLLRPSE